MPPQIFGTENFEFLRGILPLKFRLMLKNLFWYFLAQSLSMLIALLAFLFSNEIQRGAYMLNFIVLGYIVKKVIDIKQSNQYLIKKTIPNRRVLIFLLLSIAIVGFTVFGINHSLDVFTISLICGALGLSILIYITRYVQKIQ